MSCSSPRQEPGYARLRSETRLRAQPHAKAALLKNPPGAHSVSAEELNVDPVQAKSVPTFCLKGECV